jgi:tetratricopeptide (TPR) repeat protein
VRFYLMEAELLLQNQRLDEGMALLQEALSTHPEQPNLLYLRSLVSEKLGRFELMEADLRIIIAQDPDNAVALNALGYVLANRGEQLTEARELIQRALAAKPDDPAILDSLGWVEYRLGNLDQAQKLLQRAYEKFPDPEVAAHLGEVLWMRGLRQQAKTVWQQSLEQHPDSAPLLETLQRLQPELKADGKR